MPVSHPLTDKRSATPGRARSRTGIARHSPASATVTASGKRAAASVLPFYSRNLFDVKQWAAPLKTDDLMPTIRALTPTFGIRPPVDPVNRKLGITNDRIQSHGLDVSKALGPRGTGLVWAAVENGASIPEREALGPGGPRVARAGDEPRRDSQGQPSEHPGVCHPPRQCRAGCRRKGIDRQPRQQHPLERHDRRRRRRDRPGDPVSRTPLHRRRGLRRVAEARLRRPGRERWRHRLRRQQLERRDRAVGLRRELQSQRGRADAARHRVQRSRSLSAGRRGALQGHPPSEHAERHPSPESWNAGLHLPARQPVPSRRRTYRHHQRLEQCRMDDDAAGRRRARQLLGARGARDRQAEAEGA